MIDWKNVHSILFVCHGNICRSTMALCLMTKLLADAGITDVTVDSAATSTEELGNPIHYGAAAVLRRHKIPVLSHRARQLKSADAKNYDVFLAADSANITNMKRFLPQEAMERSCLMMELIGEKRNIADPWYTGDFDETWNDIYAVCQALLSLLLE